MQPSRAITKYSPSLGSNDGVMKHAAKVRKNLPDLCVRRLLSAETRHVRALAVAHGSEESFVGGAGGQHGGQVRAADASGVEAVASGTPGAIQERAAPDGLRIPLHGVAPRILGSGQTAAGRPKQNGKGDFPGPLHGVVTHSFLPA